MKYVLALIAAFYLTPLSSAMPDIKEQEIDCLAQNIYYEARGESTKGKIAVGHVTLNRVKHTQFGNSVCGVVTQKHKKRCQFSWVCDNKLPAIKQELYADIRNLAEKIYHGKIKDNTKGATYFHNEAVLPDWSDCKIYTGQIGNHHFYKRKKTNEQCGASKSVAKQTRSGLYQLARI